MLDEREALKLLGLIRNLALIGFPYDRDGSTIGADIVLTLNHIADTAIKTVVEHESRKVLPTRERDRTVHD